MDLCVVIPAYHEKHGIVATLDAFAEAEAGFEFETIVVDGGDDGTAEVARGHNGARVLESPPGRAKQMNAGARAAVAADADALLFLHADTHVDAGALRAMAEAIRAEPDALHAFELRYRSDDPWFRRMERGVAWRCRRFGLVYGDQGFGMSHALYERMGGFDESVRMEDLDFVLRLGRSKTRILTHSARTSTRQYDREGRFWGMARNVGMLAAGLTLHAVDGGSNINNGNGTGRTEEGDAA